MLVTLLIGLVLICTAFWGIAMDDSKTDAEFNDSTSRNFWILNLGFLVTVASGLAMWLL